MSAKEEEKHLNTEGRLYDGHAFLIRVKGEPQRVCDHDSPDAVWARIREAQKKPGTFVEFSGARADSNGKLDGWAVVVASDIHGFANFGPASMGINPIEARLAQVEQVLGEVVPMINELVEDLEGLEGELVTKGVVEAEQDEEEAPAGKVSVLPVKEDDE